MLFRSSPAYWAHLVLTGDSGPVYAKGFGVWGWILTGLAGLIVVLVVLRKRGLKTGPKVLGLGPKGEEKKSTI